MDYAGQLHCWDMAVPDSSQVTIKVVRGIVMFWSSNKKPDPDAFVDRDGYYVTMRVSQLDLYQSYFNKMLDAIKKHNYIGSTLYPQDLIKAKAIADQADKEDNLLADSLLVMLVQYIHADEFDRGEGKGWVRVV